MKFRLNFIPLVLLLFAIFTSVPKAEAQELDYVANAIAALQTSNIYVAPGTPGTDYNTPAELSAFLSPELNVVLIMLPSEAINGTDILTIAQRISIGLNNEKTIGLAVGNNLIGYSARLPESVASDLMVRADSISNNTTTALVAFSRNVQLWLIRNPQPIPTATPEPTPTPRPTMEPIQLPNTKDIPFPVKIIFFVVLFIIFAALANPIVKVSKRNTRNKYLESIGETISNISEKVEVISDAKIRKDLIGACKAAMGLLDGLLQSPSPVQPTEKQLPMLLFFMEMQVKSLIQHELRTRPIEEEMLSQLKYLLLNYDSLFIGLQQNDPQAMKLMTSMISANKIMAESLGYQTN